jgi:hypothetical protein
VDEKCRYFFSSAALAEDQNRDVRAGYENALRLDFTHPLAASDEGCVSLQGCFVHFHGIVIGVGDVFLNYVLDFPVGEGLDKNIRCAHLSHENNLLGVKEIEQDDYAEGRPGAENRSQQAQSSFARAIPTGTPIEQDKSGDRRFA